MEEGDTREPVLKDVRLLVPIEKTDSPQRVTYGVVLEPDSEDLQGDVMTAEDIEKAAYDWMERSQSGGRMHSELIEGARVVESYIAPCDIPVETAAGPETIRKGSWVLAMRWPEDIWEGIQKGELTGYSVGGTGLRLEIEKHGNHDQSEHGNWARGRTTPADQGNAAGRAERARRSAEDTYVSEHIRSTDLVDDIEERLQDMQAPGDGFKPTWEHVGTAEEIDDRLGAVLGFLTGDEDAHAQAGGEPAQFKTGEDAYSARMLSAFDRARQIRDLLQDQRAPSDDFTPNWEHAGSAQEVGRRLSEVQSFLGGNPNVNTSPRGNTYFWSAKRAGPEISTESLSDAVREGLQDAVAKHGSHDQSSHGNWARGATAAADDDEVDLLDLFDESRGATVTLDGHAYTIKETKPFKHVPGLDSVTLEPKDKNAAWYRHERAKLHDDWDLEVSDPERLVELAQQLPGWSRQEGVSKHGTHDQSTHGNWARSKELGMVRIPEDDDSPPRPEDEERDEELRRFRRTHTTRDGVTIEDQPKVQRLGGEAFASADGRVQLNYGEWKWLGAQGRAAKNPRLHERGRWGVWPRGSDRSDVSNVIWGSNKTLAEFINSLDPGEYDLAT